MLDYSNIVIYYFDKNDTFSVLYIEDSENKTCFKTASF